jgi:hypothetical protein
MKLFIVARTTKDIFSVYIVTGEAQLVENVDGGKLDVCVIDSIDDVEGIGVIANKDDWGKFFKLYKIKSMADFLTVEEYENIEDFAFTQESYGYLQKQIGGHQFWIHYYRSNMTWN